MSGSLFLIGGGSFRRGETRHLEQVWTKLLPRERVAFLPTASFGREGWEAYGKSFCSYLGEFGVETFTLPIGSREDANDPALAARLGGVGGVYLGGGDTARLIETLRETSVLAKMRTLYEDGGVLAGISAGAIALGDEGIGDEGEELKGWDFWPGRAWVHANDPEFAFMGEKLRGRDHVKLRDGEGALWRGGQLQLVPRPAS